MNGPECPNIRARVFQQFGEPGVILWRESGCTQTSKDHRQCSTDCCVANDACTDPGLPRHVTAGCTCKFVAPDAPLLRQVLDDGGLALARLEDPEDTDKLTLDVFTEGTWFVSISHAASDGLRNPYDAALPACQVQRLFAYVAATWERAGCGPRSPVRMWLDTLCLPSSEVKSDGTSEKSIRTMTKVADLASAVLVVDSDICELSQASTFSNLEMKIQFSSWNSRLWTLYETMRAKQLYFQLRNDSVPLASLQQSAGVLVNGDSSQLQSWLSHYHYWRIQFRQYDPGDHLPWNILKKMLAGRRASYMQDAPKVLALLLDPSRIPQEWQLITNQSIMHETRTSMSDAEMVRAYEDIYNELSSSTGKLVECA